MGKAANIKMKTLKSLLAKNVVAKIQLEISSKFTAILEQLWRGNISFLQLQLKVLY